MRVSLYVSFLHRLNNEANVDSHYEEDMESVAENVLPTIGAP